MKVSESFDAEEFACRSGAAYPLEAVEADGVTTWLESRLRPLCAALEIIRTEAGGGAIHINSGYRTLAYDQRLYDRSAHDGLVATPQGSQHPKGRAADIRHAVLSPVALHKLIGVLLELGKLPMVGGLGLYPTFVHVDVRPRTGIHVAQWGGMRLSNIA